MRIIIEVGQGFVFICSTILNTLKFNTKLQMCINDNIRRQKAATNRIVITHEYRKILFPNKIP